MILKNFFLSLLVFFAFCSLHTRELDNPPNGISVQKGKTYLSSGVKSNKENEEQILKLIQSLVDWTLAKDYSKLPDYVDQKKGLYPDIKGEWTYSKLLSELKNPDSYFEVFFFNREKLIQEKNSTDVWTVRELLILSEGLKADFFFETNDACEVKLHFNKSSKLQGDLNNPYFVRTGGTWKIYRLF